MAASLRPVLPRRDDEARARLESVGERVRPVTLARDRVLTPSGALAHALPDGVTRGATVVVDGRVGAGATSLAFELAAAATAAGEWAAAIDLDGTFGAEAAAAAGVVLERFAVVARVPRERWATVAAALLDGISVVIAEVPRYLSMADARRLVARAREREAVLVPIGQWPGDAALRLTAADGQWHGLTPGAGLLRERARAVRVDAHGDAVLARVV
jgi:hypothetical protein